MIVVDSSVWIDHFKNEKTRAVDILRSARRTSRIIVGDLVLLEVLRGAKSERNANEMESILRSFVLVSFGSPMIALEAARIYRSLRAEGITIRKTVDLVIATFCIVNGHQLLQSDRDFLPIAERFGLRLI